jgi:hypothetical protein
MKSLREASRENRRRFARSGRLLASGFVLLLAAGFLAADETETDARNQPPMENYRPLEDASGAVLIVPAAGEQEEAWAATADSLRRSGFDVLMADDGGARGSAVSRTDYPDAAKMDARAALDSLRRLPGAIAVPVVLVGSGEGCLSVLTLREADRESIVFVLVSPGGVWEPRAADARPALWGRPVLVIAGKDDLLSIEASAAILREAPQPECWIVDGRGRGAELLQSRPDLITRLTAWITRSAGAPGEEP